MKKDRKFCVSVGNAVLSVPRNVGDDVPYKNINPTAGADIIRPKKQSFLPESVKEHRQKRLRIIAQRVVAVAKTPIIEKRSFKQCIRF